MLSVAPALANKAGAALAAAVSAAFAVALSVLAFSPDEHPANTSTTTASAAVILRVSG